MKLEWIQSAEVKGVVGGIKGQRRHLSGWKGWHQVSRQTDEPCSTGTAAFWLLHYAAQRPSRGITNVCVYSGLLPSTDFNALSRTRARTKILTCTFQLTKALGIFDQPEIWLSQTCFSLCNRVHVTSSCRNSLLPLVCVCERLLRVCQWEVKHAGCFHMHTGKQQLLLEF